MPNTEEPDDPAAFVLNVPLTDIFGTHPKTRIIVALLAEESDPPTHFTVNEIKRIAGVDEKTVIEQIDDLLAYGIVVETDHLDEKTATYKLNEGTDVAVDIRQLYNTLFEVMPEPDAHE
ncbi:winged helix-turn-helix domain-containing protein [Natrialbaceae archaeon A-gly3]